MDLELNNEKAYLKKVTDKINFIMGNNDEQVSELREYIREERSRMWEDFFRTGKKASDMEEVIQITQTEKIDTLKYDRLKTQSIMLKRQKNTPYFARLDFKEDGLSVADKIYIGYFSLTDNNSSDVLICDWRADISAMFYDSALGRARYSSPLGIIEGDLLLRRQFKIVDSELKYMFDSDIAIEDDILQEELGKSADLKLKTIITTIQKEQNKIIRELSCNLLLVQGTAGSGKTSIALHRLAYLLYKYRNTLTSGNIIIFSPNNIFNAYIADVLPDLGEDKVIQTSFYEFFSNMLGEKVIEDYTQQIEKLISDYDEIREKSIELKGSKEFADALEIYFNEKGQFEINLDILEFNDNIIFTKEKIEKMYIEDFKGYTPEVRLKKIKNIAIEYTEENLKEEQLKKYEPEITEDGVLALTDDEMRIALRERWERDIELFKNKIDKMLSIDIYKLYLEVIEEEVKKLSSSYNNEIYKQTKENIEKGFLNYEDTAPILFLKMLVGRLPVLYKITQVVVDEAQDYPPIFYMILNRIFKNAKFTILGDINQSISTQKAEIAAISSYFSVPESKRKYFSLNKSYRSTVEINNFLKSFNLSLNETTFLERHGEKPRFIDISMINERKAQIILNETDALKDKGFYSIAIVCKTAADCKILYENIKNINNDSDVNLIGNDDIIYPKKTIIIPSYLIKGLEFDGIIIEDAGKNKWKTNQDNQL
ncbi:MAG: helD, partial [Clostridia bacterium]|nr:helD [Clostridia bacterium]